MNCNALNDFSVLEKASDGTLDEAIQHCLQYDVTNHSNNSSEVELNNFVLNQSGVSEEGRLILPAVWNKSVIHRLPDNYNLAYNVLKSTYKKYEKQPDKLHQYDMTIKMQLDQG